MAIGFCTSGSAAKTPARNPAGILIAAAASAGGRSGVFVSGSELYGCGKSAANAYKPGTSNTPQASRFIPVAPSKRPIPGAASGPAIEDNQADCPRRQ